METDYNQTGGMARAIEYRRPNRLTRMNAPSVLRQVLQTGSDSEQSTRQSSPLAEDLAAISSKRMEKETSVAEVLTFSLSASRDYAGQSLRFANAPAAALANAHRI
jgi:hypothetical protein